MKFDGKSEKLRVNTKKSGITKRRKGKCRLLLALTFIISGMALLAYPIVSNSLYKNESQALIISQNSIVSEKEEDEIEQVREAARAYNVRLKELFIEEALGNSRHLEEKWEELHQEYAEQLAMDETGIMGYVEIPSIDVSLPIYHGADSLVLEKGAGHVENSSLPIGGLGTHSVITGHTGLGRARMFTDLTSVQQGDIFYICVLGEKMEYRVDQIRVVLPTEMSELAVVEGKDYVTLITCTPYGVNTHRLLVRGERVAGDAGQKDAGDDEYEEDQKESSKESAEESKWDYLRESLWLREYLKAIFTGLVSAGAAFALLLIIYKKIIYKKIKSKNKGG